MKVFKFNGKKFIKYTIKISVATFVILFLIFAPFSVFPKLFANQNMVNKSLNLNYMGVLELWNIDTFEGGSVSRTQWLSKRAIQFESVNKGVYIMVTNMSVEQAKLNFENNKKPNMISFGIGVGDVILPNLIKYKGKMNVRDDLLKGGTNDGVVYAVPYILGGYIITSENQIVNNLQNLGYGEDSNNCFSLALAMNDYTCTNFYEENQDLDSFSAYDKYLQKKFSTLCGTQRDAYRINNKIANGSLNNQNIKYLSNFSDLVQYIGICDNSAIENEICTKFIEYITNEESQLSLCNISMFSVLPIKIYTTGYLNEMENVLLKPIKTLNVFIQQQFLKNIKESSRNYIMGKTNEKSNYSKYLI